MDLRRTDLALEAHELWQSAANGAALAGLSCAERSRLGLPVTQVCVRSERAGRALGKPPGVYLTLDLRTCPLHDRRAFTRAVQALAGELRPLLPARAKSFLVAGLGNAAMTPDALGPRTAARIPATRHLGESADCAALAPVSVLAPGVLGQTGIEAAEQIACAVRTVGADAVLAVDALASRRLGRVCTTVQLSDAGIVPGSGVGNHRRALTRETLGVPVVAVGVPTVVDAATLAADLLEEAGAPLPDPAALRGPSLTVTPRDIDAQIDTLSRLLALGIGLALQPGLTLRELELLTN